MIHALVKPTISTTGIFDSFFAKMGETFGYGNKNPELWWDKNLPVIGQDSTLCDWGGSGYK